MSPTSSLARAVPWLAVVTMAVVGALANVAPPPLPVDAPPTSFSGLRAHGLVERIADRPHLIGSPANALVRDRVVSALRGLGLDVTTDRSLVVYDHPLRAETRTRAAWPENIVATLPGMGDRRGPGEAILLMSHYDSVATGHGAADAMAGVATIIEALRALVAGGESLERDVIVLITDGEEVGLFGAQAFFRGDPRADRAGLVLNFEARGAAGPSSMFQTGAGNGGWVREFARAVPRPDAASVSVEVYRRMPNDTDATITLEAGIPFLNFAFIDDFYRYHAGADVAANLSPRSLQHQGDNLLALLEHFGRRDWPESDADATYFRLLPGLLVSYGPGAALASAVIAGLLGVLALLSLARVSRWFTPLLGAGAVLACGAIAAGTATLLYGAARAVTPSFHLFYQYHLLLAAWVGAALLGLALAAAPRSARRVGCAALLVVGTLAALPAGQWGALLVLLAGVVAIGAPRRGPAPVTMIAGVVLLWLLLTVTVAATALHAAYLLAWPLAGVSIAILLASRTRVAGAGADRAEALVSAAWWLPLVLALPLWIPLVYALYLGVAITVPGLVALLVLLVGMLAWPALAQPRPRRALGTLGLCALLVVPWSVLRDPFSARHPQPVEVFLAWDVDQAKAWWMSRGGAPNAIERAALGADAESFDLAGWTGEGSGRGWRREADAGVITRLAPPATLLPRLDAAGDNWSLALQLAPTVQGARVLFTLPPADYVAASIDGQPVSLPRVDEGWQWDLWGLDADQPIEIVVEGTGPTPDRFVLNEYRFGALERAGVSSGDVRGDDTMARPWSLDRGVWLRSIVLPSRSAGALSQARSSRPASTPARSVDALP